MKRRNVLKQLGLGVLAAPMVMSRAFPAAAQGLEKVTVRLDWTTWGGQSPFYLPIKKGWYKDAGLDVSIEEGNGSVTTIQLVNAGQFDVGHVNLAAAMQGRAKGLSVRAIASFVRKNDVGLLVPKDSKFHSPKDLAGHKFLYTAGSLEAPFLDKFLAAGGLTRDKVDLVNVESASKNTLYVKGGADGEFTSVPYALPYTSERPSRGILFADYGMSFPGFGLISTDEKIKTRAAAVGKFATLVSAAWQYIVNGHEEEAVQAIMEARPERRPDPKILREQIDAFKPYLTSEASQGLPCGVMAAKDFDLAVHTMREANLLPAEAKGGDFYTDHLLDPAKIKQLGGS